MIAGDIEILNAPEQTELNVWHISVGIQSTPKQQALNSIKVSKLLFCAPRRMDNRAGFCHSANNSEVVERRQMHSIEWISNALCQCWLRPRGQMLNKLKVNRMLEIHPRTTMKEEPSSSDKVCGLAKMSNSKWMWNASVEKSSPCHNDMVCSNGTQFVHSKTMA